MLTLKFSTRLFLFALSIFSWILLNWKFCSTFAQAIYSWYFVSECPIMAFLLTPSFSRFSNMDKILLVEEKVLIYRGRDLHCSCKAPEKQNSLFQITQNFQPDTSIKSSKRRIFDKNSWHKFYIAESILQKLPPEILRLASHFFKTLTVAFFLSFKFFNCGNRWGLQFLE